jgi:ATP-dependent DNA ligase
LDILWFDGEWIGERPFQARWEMMNKIVKSINNLGLSDIDMCENGNSDLMETYERSKSNPLTEGIVVKNVLGKLIGNKNRCQDNPGWIKVKWRA